MLSSYSLTLDQLRQLGFPMDSSLYPGNSWDYSYTPAYIQVTAGIINLHQLISR